MALIFGGVDFPVFETVLIVTALQVIGLVLMLIAIVSMLKEIRILRALHKEEEKDIKQFEADLKELEKFEATEEGKVEEQLKRYIKEYLGKGYTEAQLKKSLMQQGWKDKQLEKVFKGL